MVLANPIYIRCVQVFLAGKSTNIRSYTVYIYAVQAKSGCETFGGQRKGAHTKPRWRLLQSKINKGQLKHCPV